MQETQQHLCIEDNLADVHYFHHSLPRHYRDASCCLHSFDVCSNDKIWNQVWQHILCAL